MSSACWSVIVVHIPSTFKGTAHSKNISFQFFPLSLCTLPRLSYWVIVQKTQTHIFTNLVAWHGNVVESRGSNSACYFDRPSVLYRLSMCLQIQETTCTFLPQYLTTWPPTSLSKTLVTLCRTNSNWPWLTGAISVTNQPANQPTPFDTTYTYISIPTYGRSEQMTNFHQSQSTQDGRHGAAAALSYITWYQNYHQQQQFGAVTYWNSRDGGREGGGRQKGLMDEEGMYRFRLSTFYNDKTNRMSTRPGDSKS